ncbi:patatin-like phospholipase family protein [Paucibacter sp. Y2R2-4]|uniref:patatin-like phospholipase family protein n=1 Tax=Paucibacter sp. Y2R2-4 TaxID=2893553 RepID=UPI0021E3EEDC|nr:patatin-like phospholipase family protein [Paucibacter sp. Y2R2-4]MCV2350925.1 patatin-like phospholipase family protein [Paucibacter sp. Y2R2-4]
MNNSPSLSAGSAAPAPCILNLALQGGGSHGAFTWGVLDALLEDGHLQLEGISGTSAGAMNAVALAHGFAQAAGGDHQVDPLERARESLAAFWDGVIQLGALSEAQRAPFALLFGHCGNQQSSLAAIWMQAMNSFWTATVSPYQSNPLDLNPLRDFVCRHIDFERLQKISVSKYSALVPKVFVVATRVRSGKAEVFSGKRLSLDAVMASACLPTLYKAVEIEGDHFWDGGYSGNPAIHPLIYECAARDVLLVQINPIQRDKLPTTPSEIMDRLNEVSFNAGLIAEMRAIDFVKHLLAEGRLDPTHYKDVLMHRIDGGEALEAFAASSKSSTSASLIHELRDLGRAQAQAWLRRNRRALGQHSTVNIKQDYLDDLRLPVQRS